MRGTGLVLGIGLVVAALALAGCGGDDDDSTATDTDTVTETTTDTTETTEAGGTLTGTVGPGFTITLTNEAGDSVSTLLAGSYTIEVDDQSDIHNFHLTGPGVEETTDIAEVGTQSWEVTFEEGSYTYVCDPHASSMTGSFTVTP
ncbi:MAG: hypothetical protein H0U82_11615 [Actinobacteria bacterium]|nr:hypothetical protein [Actinomycetota bacterium]